MLVGYRWLQAIYRKLTTENLVKHRFPRPQDMSLTENSYQVFIPVGFNRTQNFEIWSLHYYICYEASTSRQLLSLFK